jgi:hypothetical protein
VGVFQRAILGPHSLTQHADLQCCLQAVDIYLGANRSEHLFGYLTDDGLYFFGESVRKFFGEHELVMDALGRLC